MLVEGQAAIVSGGASGLGRATAEALAAAGVKVAILDVNEASAAAAARETGGFAIRCDVTDAAAVEAALRRRASGTARRASPLIAPASAPPGGSSGATGRCRWMRFGASSRSI